jgi:hypothetical protein
MPRQIKSAGAASFSPLYNQGEVETGVGAEFLEFDLGFKAILGFHYHVYEFVSVGVPLFDPAQVSGAAFVVDDEWHNSMAQAFLQHK